MIINLSNHTSSKWSEKQIKTANKLFGDIIDMPFPAVGAEASTDEIQAMADEAALRITEMHPDAVMCQGEFTLTYAVVSRLKQNGIKVVSACSERSAKETLLPDGRSEKKAVFDFVQFREY